VWTRVNIVRADRNTPGFMRAPPETPYLFALESAIDELAVALGMDPIELRRINDTQREPIKGLPYTSRGLMRCFDQAAAAFGWSQRKPQPGAMREGEWMIGLGCASAAYHASIGASTARVSLTPGGSVRVETAAHDIGTGAYTIIAMTAADRLGVDISKVTVEIGDSDLPPAGLAAGSTHTASVCNVVAKACDEIRERIRDGKSRSQPADPYREPVAGQLATSLAGVYLLAARQRAEPEWLTDQRQCAPPPRDCAREAFCKLLGPLGAAVDGAAGLHPDVRLVHRPRLGRLRLGPLSLFKEPRPPARTDRIGAYLSARSFHVSPPH